MMLQITTVNNQSKLCRLKKMSQWLTILFNSLLNQFWSQLHDSGFVGKPGYYTFFTKNFRVLDHVSRLHQSDLSKSCKYWDIFLSHCIDNYGAVRVTSMHACIWSCELPTRNVVGSCECMCIVMWTASRFCCENNSRYRGEIGAQYLWWPFLRLKLECSL
jgi:hypothetical protein